MIDVGGLLTVGTMVVLTMPLGIRQMRKVTTFDQFRRNVRSWAEGYIQTLLVVGPPGVGKTTTIREVIAKVQEENKEKSTDPDPPEEPGCHHLTGRMSAIEVFRLLRDEPLSLVVFDDLSGILGDRHFITLLQQLCETRPFRWISWKTNAPILKGEKTGFVCVARVLVVLNKVPRNNEPLQAVLDRMDAISFEPTKAEILTKMRQVWPEHPDLIDLLVDLPVEPSLRHLVKAIGWQKSPHLNEVEELLSECGVPEPIQCLYRIMLSEPEASWLARYREKTGKSERSFRRHKRTVRKLIAARTDRRQTSEGESAGCDDQEANDKDDMAA